MGDASAPFTWTGGSINATSNVATYKLAGASGHIGTDSTSLSTGSRILIASSIDGLGSYIQQAGVVSHPNDTPIEIEQWSTFEQRRINANPPNDPEVGDVITKGVAYSNGGKAKSVLVQQNGWLKVSKDGMLVTERVPGSGSNYGVKMTNGKITIQCGGTLTATHGVHMLDGRFETTEDTAGNPSFTVTIDGSFSVDGGVIRLTDPNENDYTTLNVTADMQLNDGLFDAGVKGTQDFVCDKIVAHTVTAPTTFEVKLTEKEGAAAVGRKWDLIVALDTFYGGLTDFPTPNQPLLYTGSLSPDGKSFRMTKK